jgi:hypothetical protein
VAQRFEIVDTLLNGPVTQLDFQNENLTLAIDSPVTGCKPKGDDSSCTCPDNEIKEVLDVDQITQFLLELPQNLKLHDASYAAAVKCQYRKVRPLVGKDLNLPIEREYTNTTTCRLKEDLPRRSETFFALLQGTRGNINVMIQVGSSMCLQTGGANDVSTRKSMFWRLYEAAETHCVTDEGPHISARRMLEEWRHNQLSVNFGCCLFLGYTQSLLCTYSGCQSQQLFVRVILELLLVA